jgi:hypothetical protein
MLERLKNYLPVAIENIKALEISISLQIPWPNFVASNGWEVRFMCHIGLAVSWRTILVQKFPTDYLEKLIA